MSMIGDLMASSLAASLNPNAALERQFGQSLIAQQSVSATSQAIAAAAEANGVLNPQDGKELNPVVKATMEKLVAKLAV